jgi:hypothetical protein
MKIGIISDTHDGIEKTEKVLDLIKKKGADVLIHCGDFSAPFMMQELAKFDGEVHCIFGNTADRFATPKIAGENGINFHGDIAKLEFDGKKILVNHFPDIARAFAFTGEYDAVFYGHSHISNKEKIKDTLLVNPGNLLEKAKEKSSFAIYDTELNDAEIIELE